MTHFLTLLSSARLRLSFDDKLTKIQPRRLVAFPALGQATERGESRSSCALAAIAEAAS